MINVVICFNKGQQFLDLVAENSSKCAAMNNMEGTPRSLNLWLCSDNVSFVCTENTGIVF